MANGSVGHEYVVVPLKYHLSRHSLHHVFRYFALNHENLDDKPHSHVQIKSGLKVQEPYVEVCLPEEGEGGKRGHILLLRLGDNQQNFNLPHRTLNKDLLGHSTNDK